MRFATLTAVLLFVVSFLVVAAPQDASGQCCGPVVVNYAPQPVVTYYAPPVTTYYAPAPVTTYYAPAPVTAYYAPST